MFIQYNWLISWCPRGLGDIFVTMGKILGTILLL